jgi:hypothetical protein
MPHETKCQSGSRLPSDADADAEVDKLIEAGLIRELREPTYPGGPLDNALSMDRRQTRTTTVTIWRRSRVRCRAPCVRARNATARS